MSVWEAIQKLEAKNARLREALLDIYHARVPSQLGEGPMFPEDLIQWMQSVAVGALQSVDGAVAGGADENPGEED